MLILRETPNGRGLFADTPYRKGQRIYRYHGPLLSLKQQTPGFVADHSLQIGPESFFGPSGDKGDYVNHSCDPNAGIVIASLRGVHLTAVRDIPAGEEIVFDYSTTMSNDPWTMECRCGAPACRRVIREYRTLPPDLQRRYCDLGIVPWYCIGYVVADSYLP
jgi:hypothetical protein